MGQEPQAQQGKSITYATYYVENPYKNLTIWQAKQRAPQTPI